MRPPQVQLMTDVSVSGRETLDLLSPLIGIGRPGVSNVSVKAAELKMETPSRLSA